LFLKSGKQERVKMSFDKTLNRKIVFAAILTLMLALSLASVSVVTAHNPPLTYPTYAFLAAVPNPVGINQQMQISFWLDKPPPTANVQYGDRWSFTVTVTLPDGNTEQKGPFTSDDVGGSYMLYTPTMLGTYYFQMHFAGQTLEGANPPPYGNTSPNIGDYYSPSESEKVAVTVQQNAIEPYPSNPIPSGYWQRPINGMNSNWQSIAGDWLNMGGSWNEYSQAPDSAHILWSYPIAFGGVNGNPTYEDWNYYTGLAYEAKFNSPLIMYGRLIFNMPISDAAGTGGAICIDLRTGETIWHIDQAVSFGQEFDYNSPNQFGVIPYLWSSGSTMMFAAGGASYTAYDPMTGAKLFSIVNVTTGPFSFGGSTMTFGPSGELISYVFDPAHGWLAQWNSTQCIMWYVVNGGAGFNNIWTWRPPTDGMTQIDWSHGVQWNNTHVKDYPDAKNQSLMVSALTPDVILTSTGINDITSTTQNWQWEVGYSTKDGSELWAVNRTTPMGATTWALFGPATKDVYTEFHLSEMSWYGFDTHTGKQIWGPTEPYPDAFGMYSFTASTAYGLLLGLDFGGYLHAYDLNTGVNVWNFYAGSSGLETAYGNWPLNNPAPVAADGKIYVVSGHAYNPPLFKGARIYCLDANDGTLLWSELGFYNYDPVEVADGCLVAYNCYDGQVYCYGKGLSATTVTATPGVGETVTIQGSITDQSPGNTSLGIPAKGTPAISDQSMSDWMAYLYMQQPMPADATGVPVTLYISDENNNIVDTLTATSDMNGHFSAAWNPPDTGIYTITAAFDGTKSYYASTAETAISVNKSTQSSTTGTSLVSNETLYLVIIAVLAVIAVVAIAIALRKRK
jgi:outer membrane protein assembly factor BamB